MVQVHRCLLYPIIVKIGVGDAQADVDDACRGKLYWALTVNGEERIETSNGDGSGRRVILDSTTSPLLSGVSSMLLEPDSNLLYWVNSGSRSMQYLDVRTGKTTTVRVI